jgi:hypothetical protein
VGEEEEADVVGVKDRARRMVAQLSEFS